MTTAANPLVAADTLVELRLREMSREWIGLSIVLVLAAVLWMAFAAMTHLRLEDALITYRYAQHLASGDGFVFNAGQRVLGTTTPLQAMLLALAGAISGVREIPRAASVLMIVAGLGAATMTFLAVKQTCRSASAGLLAAGAFCAQPTTLWMTTGGMETPLVVLLMAVSLFGLARRSHYVAAVAAALLVLTRIDGAIWAGLVLVVIVWRDRRQVAGPWAAAISVLLPWVAFAEIYFGSVIPHTVIAKNAIRFTEAFSWNDHVRWVMTGWWSFVPTGPITGTIAGLALAGFGALLQWRRTPDCVVPFLVIYQLAFAAAFLAGKAPHFPWYLIPLSWSALVLAMIGVWHAIRLLAARRLAAVAVSALVVYGGLLAYRDRQAVADWALNQRNEQVRRDVGDWLRQNTPSGAGVAMEAIGYQGFYSERRVIDLAGLVSPEVVAIHQTSASHAEAFKRIQAELRPDYIVLRSFEVDRNHDFHGGKLFDTAAEQAFFATHYTESHRFVAPRPDLWGELACLSIYRRREAAPGLVADAK